MSFCWVIALFNCSLRFICKFEDKFEKKQQNKIEVFSFVYDTKQLKQCPDYDLRHMANKNGWLNCNVLLQTINTFHCKIICFKKQWCVNLRMSMNWNEDTCLSDFCPIY